MMTEGDRLERARAALEDAEGELEGFRCPSTAGCCHFERTGREPYVTAAEWALIENEIARQGRRLSSLRSDGACPFLSPEERCLVYRLRPLGCRTFYCALASGPRPVERGLFTRHVRELEVISESLGETGRGRGRPLRSWLRERVEHRAVKKRRRYRFRASTATSTT